MSRPGRRGLLAALLALTWAMAAGGTARAEKEDREKLPPPPGMKSRVIQIKHQDVESIADALKPLGSGMPGAMLRANESLRTVAVRDFPENLAGIEQAIKRLDLPGPVRPDVELRIYVLIGSPASVTGPLQYPSELGPVVRQLSDTLSFRSYFQVAALTQRLRHESGSSGKGEVMLAAPVVDQPGPAHFDFGVNNVRVGPSVQGSGPLLIGLKRFHFELEGGPALGAAKVSTGLTLREGEKVVLAGSLKNRAMIVVLSAKLLK